MQNLSVIITFILYLGLMLGIGMYFYKKTNNLSDYVLGGRQLGPWGTSISAQASDMSGWLLLGLPGAAYLSGLSGGVWMAGGLALGTYLNWKFVAKKLRVHTEKYNNSITLSSYLENRFNDESRILRITSALFILIFFLVYTASGFVAGGKLFQTVFNIPYFWAILISSIVVIGYTFLGGFMAVCYTDIIQGLLMFFTLIILPIIVLCSANSLSDVTSAIDPSLLNIFDAGAITGDPNATITLVIIGIISSISWGLGYFGQPHILARFMAIKDPDLIKKSRFIAMVWVIISLIGAMSVGLIGRYVFPELPGGDSERIFMLLVGKCVPTLLSGILLSAILAAVMSTADSQLLVTASTFSEDFYKTLIKPNASDKELVTVSRLTVIGVALIAFIIALNPDSSVLNLVSYAWAGFGSAFGPVVLLSLFWNKMTKKGAIYGMIVGGITSIVWPLLSSLFPNIIIFKLYEIIPGFILASLTIYICSKLQK